MCVFHYQDLVTKVILFRIVRAMISHHPFNKWPLHVKLFTHEAVNHWEASTQALPLPIGFTCSIELEGVDGKSGKTGSGRKGPLSVTDGECRSHPVSMRTLTRTRISEQFTSAILAKNTALVASGVPLECSVCKESLDEYAVVCFFSPCCALSLNAIFLTGTPNCMSLPHTRMHDCISYDLSFTSFPRW